MIKLSLFVLTHFEDDGVEAITNPTKRIIV
jgi:hypothetical protein